MRVILILLFLAGCAIEPSHHLRDRKYCERKDNTYICPGTEHEDTTLDWLVRTQRERTRENH